MGGTGPRYRNGYIPSSELVLIEGNHPATRGTAARWENLKADVLANEGVRLRITGGENAYRSFSGQQFARQQACARGRCNDAAVPGTSSHGGSLNGRDSGAIDVDNWSVLGKEKFYSYCRRNGFDPGYFDWEPWHIIDWAPYTVPAGAAGGATAPKPIPFYARPYGRSKEKTMLALMIKDGRGAFGPPNKTRTYLVGGGLFVDTTNHATADQVSVIVQGYDANGKVHATPNLTYRDLYDYARGSNALTELELAPYKAAAGA